MILYRRPTICGRPVCSFMSLELTLTNERLFLSVPSEQNWVITLNGEPAETELIGDCLYSIKLTNGINNITMTYHIRYFKLGILVTVFTLFCYIGYVLLRKKAYNKNWCKEA